MANLTNLAKVLSSGKVSAHAQFDTNISFQNVTIDDVPTAIFSDKLFVFFGIPLCLENLLALIVLCRSERLIYQVRFLSINLAVTDCLAGLGLTIPDAVFGKCNIKKYMFVPFMHVQMLTVTLITFDRCLALKFAYKYSNIMTKRAFYILCAVPWIVGMVSAYLQLYDASHPFGIACLLVIEGPPSTVREVGNCFELVTILLNIPMYIYMGYAVSRLFVKVDGHSVSTDVTSVQIHVIKKLAVITGFFLICFIPFSFIQVIPKIDYENSTVKLFLSIAAGLRILNSAINPVIYVWSFTEARYQFNRLLFFWSPTRLNNLKIERNNYFATYSINSKDTGVSGQLDIQNKGV